MLPSIPAKCKNPKVAKYVLGMLQIDNKNIHSETTRRRRNNKKSMIQLHPRTAHGDDVRLSEVFKISFFSDAASWAKFDIRKNLSVGFKRAQTTK